MNFFHCSTQSVTLSKKVPDSITSWFITGFSVDPVTGLGLTNEPSKLVVFRPFFVTTNLPYSIRRGEVVTIPILVYNYMDEDQDAEIILSNDNGEFEFVAVEGQEYNYDYPEYPDDAERLKTVQVKAQSGTTVSFMIRPLKAGEITIKAVGKTPLAGDGLEKKLIVEPEGVTQFMNKAILIDLRSSNDFKSKISIAVPSNAVPDSTKVEVSAVGDILGPSLDNLDRLM
jgi:CD109 antigen